VVLEHLECTDEVEPAARNDLKSSTVQTARVQPSRGEPAARNQQRLLVEVESGVAKPSREQHSKTALTAADLQHGCRIDVAQKAADRVITEASVQRKGRCAHPAQLATRGGAVKQLFV